MAPSLRTRLMRAGLDVLTAARADRWPLPRADWRGAVLMLHRVRPAAPAAFQPNAHLEITPEYLDAVLARLAERGIPVVPIAEARERLARRERFAVLTFDDGYRDNLEYALPVLKRHGAPFTVYVATGMIDGTASAWWLTLQRAIAGAQEIALELPGRHHCFAGQSVSDKRRAFVRISRLLAKMGVDDADACVRRLAAQAGVDIAAMLRSEMMSWGDLEVLAAEPLATIGGHSASHPSLARLDASAARAEIVSGLERIERRLGRRPTHFSYPFGGRHDVSARELAMIRDLGLSTAVTTGRGLLRPDDAAGPYAWPRLSLNGHFQSLPVLDVLLSGIPAVPGRSRWLRALAGTKGARPIPSDGAGEAREVRECA